MTVSLRERNRRAAMDQVRAVAFDLMSASGFDAVTVEEIATRASVSPSTVYRYFGTKEALVLSASRPELLVERLRSDDATGGWAASFQRAAVKVWSADDTAMVELGLVVVNEPLLHAWERQLLDQRGDIAAAFAQQRGKSGAKDHARAAAAVAVLTTTLLRWHGDGGGKKSLDRLLTKAFDAARTD